MEPDRASAVRLHHPELARQAAADPPGDRPVDRQPHRPVPPSTAAPTPRASGCPMPRWTPSIFGPPHFTATGTTPLGHDSPQTDAVVRAQALSREEGVALARDFVQCAFVNRGMVADLNVRWLVDAH